MKMLQSFLPGGDDAARIGSAGIRPKRLEVIFIAVIFVWPFVFLLPYTLRLLSPGNDFGILYYDYKLFYIASLAEGHVPLWNPMEASGFPFYANPFVQPIYPLNLLYLLHYKLVGGFSYWDYTLYTIAAFGVFGIGLYLWLRRLSIDAKVALAAVLIALMSLKLTETIRFPNAAHSAAWMPWMLYGVTLATDRATLWKGSVIAGLASFMLLTAGYPYYIVYTLFLLGPFGVAMVFPPTRDVLLRARRAAPTESLRLCLGLGACLLVATLAALPWLLQVKHLMAQTQDRGGASFKFALGSGGAPLDTLGSLIFPPAASFEGWFYFGIMAVLLIALYFTDLLSRSFDRKSDRRLAIAVSAWMAFIVYFTWGQNSVLFTAAWHYLPPIQQLRAWPRIDIILVPAIALLLALALSHWLAGLSRVDSAAHVVRGLRPIWLLIFAGLVLAVQYYLWSRHQFNPYWDLQIGARLKTDAGGLTASGAWRLVRGLYGAGVFLAMTCVAYAAIAVIDALARQRPMRGGHVLAVVVIVSFGDLFFVSNIQWARPFVADKREAIAAVDMARSGFLRPRVMAANTIDPRKGTQYVLPIPNWGFMRHTAVLNRYVKPTGQPLATTDAKTFEAVRHFYGGDDAAQRLFFSRTIDHDSIAGFLSDAAKARPSLDSLRVLAYDGDRLSVAISNSDSGWLSFIDNWDIDWTASLDGRPVVIARLFGSYKSVPVPAGQSTIVFSYWPHLWRINQ